MVRPLLQARADVNARPGTPTWVAAGVYALAAARYGLGSRSKLIEALALAHRHGATPLSAAVFQGNANAVEVLVKARADLSLPVRFSTSAAAYVAENRTAPMAEVLNRALAGAWSS